MIRELVQNTPLFETHDHQPGFSRHHWDAITFREFMSYAVADVEVAFGPGHPKGPLSDAEFMRRWPFVRTTGYGQAVELGVRALFDIEFSASATAEVTACLGSYVKDRTPSQVYAELFTKAGIVGTVNDILPATDLSTTTRMDSADFPAFFKFAPRFDMLLAIENPAPVQALEETLACSITKLSDLEQAIQTLVSNAIGLGHVAAIKIGVAYNRDLDFEAPSRSEAEAAFSALLANRPTDLRPLHNSLFDSLIRCARNHGLPVQIHTGYLAGCWTDLRQGDPAPLVPVFMRYPDVRFDLFHAAWPWSEFIGAVAKHFPNVWVDLCWAWSMNPQQMERILDEWLGAVPCNKILGYGSDTTTPFAVLGYAQQARNGIAAVLERKISRGEYDEATARFVAGRIMHENARDLFTPGR